MEKTRSITIKMFHARMFKDEKGVESVAVKILQAQAEEILQFLSELSAISREQLDGVAAVLIKEIKAEYRKRGIATIWGPLEKVAPTQEAIALAGKLKKLSKDTEPFVKCVIACNELLESAKDQHHGNLLFATMNFGAAKAALDIQMKKAKSASFGGLARAEKYNNVEKAVLSIWRSEIDPKISADKAAEEIIGRVNLSHRKISQIIRNAKRQQQNES